MHRCLELAKLGAGHVAPNPMVGAALVHDDRIIGEGWHQQYGEPHAEANAISRAVQNGLKELIPQSTLYVSLEPCSHFGKTPPCTDLIIQNKIPKVIIGCRDSFKEVDGNGIEKLKGAGVEVVTGILEEECKELNKRFFTFHTQHRPYVILKWAQTADGFIAPPPPEREASPSPSKGGVLESSKLKDSLGLAEDSEVPLAGGFREARLLISNEYTNRLVHQWRGEEASILVGTNTALQDDPELTNRLWPGPSPVRLVVDMELKLSPALKLFNRKVKTIVFNTIKHEEQDNLLYYQVTHDVSLVHQMVNALYQLKIQSVIVEGGTRLLQSFIDEGVWDEARVIVNDELAIGNGLSAPVLPIALKTDGQILLTDKIEIFKPAT